MLACAVAHRSSRAAAFRRIMRILLQADCSFGAERPGRIIYAYDPLGEDYAPPVYVPAHTLHNAAAALAYLERLATYYHHSLSLAWNCAATAIELTARFYDENDALLVTLDLPAAAWRRSVRACRSTRAASTALIALARRLFVEAEATFVLIGPASLLATCGTTCDAALARAVPIALLRWTTLPPDLPGGCLHTETLAEGLLLVRAWNAARCAPNEAALASD